MAETDEGGARGGVPAAWGVETPEQAEALLHDAAATATGRRRLGALRVRRTGRWPGEGGCGPC